MKNKTWKIDKLHNKQLEIIGINDLENKNAKGLIFL